MVVVASLKDTTISATRVEEVNRPVTDNPAGKKGLADVNVNPNQCYWQVRIVDSFSGKSCEVKWSDLEYASVMYLMLANDPDEDDIERAVKSNQTGGVEDAIRKAYRIAEPLMANIPPGCRCIP